MLLKWHDLLCKLLVVLCVLAALTLMLLRWDHSISCEATLSKKLFTPSSCPPASHQARETANSCSHRRHFPGNPPHISGWTHSVGMNRKCLEQWDVVYVCVCVCVSTQQLLGTEKPFDAAFHLNYDLNRNGCHFRWALKLQAQQGPSITLHTADLCDFWLFSKTVLEQRRSGALFNRGVNPTDQSAASPPVI